MFCKFSVTEWKKIWIKQLNSMWVEATVTIYIDFDPEDSCCVYGNLKVV